MSNVWFRSWHGAPTDPKWILIAKRSETQPGTVSAIVWALFDFASQNSTDRGSIDGFDIETYAAFSGFDEALISRVISALQDKNVIVNNRLSAWEKRQPKREDNSTERVREHRNALKRDETQCNAPDKDTDTDKETEKEQKKKEPRAVALGDLPKDYREQFWSMYPNRVGKPAAMSKLEAVRKSGTTWAQLTAGLERYIRSRPQDRSWLNLATFLNQRRFEDEPAEIIPFRSPGSIDMDDICPPSIYRGVL